MAITGYIPLTIQFNNQSTGDNLTYLWSFGDGTTSTEQNPIHTFNTVGVRTVTLTTTNEAGLVDTTEDTVSAFQTAPPHLDAVVDVHTWWDSMASVFGGNNDEARKFFFIRDNNVWAYHLGDGSWELQREAAGFLPTGNTGGPNTTGGEHWDAVYWNDNNFKLYAFYGDQYWRWNRGGLYVDGDEQIDATGTPSLDAGGLLIADSFTGLDPTLAIHPVTDEPLSSFSEYPMDACFHVGRAGYYGDSIADDDDHRSYFFRGDLYWRYNHGSGVPDGYPKTYGDGTGRWEGVPHNLDAATYRMIVDNVDTVPQPAHIGEWTHIYYFFKGTQYWRYNHGSGVPDGYPKNIEDQWGETDIANGQSAQY